MSKHMHAYLLIMANTGVMDAIANIGLAAKGRAWLAIDDDDRCWVYANKPVYEDNGAYHNVTTPYRPGCMVGYVDIETYEGDRLIHFPIVSEQRG